MNRPPDGGDHGLTHGAIECRDLDRTIDFYRGFGGFDVVHRRPGIAWISDRTRPFAVVLVERDEVRPLGPFAHLGCACRDHGDFDRRIDAARAAELRGEGWYTIAALSEGEDGAAHRCSHWLDGAEPRAY